MATTSKLRVPIVTFLNGVGKAVRKEFAASSTPAGDHFRSGKLEFVDMPLPTLVGNYVNRLLDGQKTVPVEKVPTFTLTRAGRFLPQVMGQYVFGYVTLFERMVLEAIKFQTNGEYARPQMAQFRPSPTVTIGVLGLGDIGQGVGKMLRGAGYKVLAFKR
ncbi:hypothetical protein PC121_g4642 [Phytophthora cactorum]|nr:hypothetical protein PC120_g2664 [Phytophthora cactorum]KAG3087317.1 hypothetical protein PC121_g4642 [Phytophthora cactorum]